MRPHIAAIYAFARTADDFADEPGVPTAERLRRLDDWRATARPLRRSRHRRSRRRSARDDLIFVALAHTIRDVSACPRRCFTICSARFDRSRCTTRYATWDDVLDYCRRSANPVGRLVLRVAGYDDPASSTRDRTRSARRCS